MLFLALYRMFKGTELLSFDRPEETDKVRRFPTFIKAYIYIINHHHIPPLGINRHHAKKGGIVEEKQKYKLK